MPTTITISRGTKEVLESIRGRKKWDVFLRELAEEYMKVKRDKVRRELKKLLVEETRIKEWAREY
jgi:hypothetical protein